MTINGTSVSVTAGTSPTTAGIQQALVTAINANATLKTDVNAIRGDSGEIIIQLKAGTSVSNVADLSTAASTTGTGGTTAHSVSTTTAVDAFTYIPNANFSGTDSFKFRVEDPSGRFDNTKAITVTVDAVNDAPTTSAANAVTDAASAVTIPVTTADVEGDTVVLTQVDGQAITAGAAAVTLSSGLGSVTLSADGKSLVYTPNASATAIQNLGDADSVPVTISYTVTDDGTSASGSDPKSTTNSFTVTVGGANDAPVGNDDTASVDADDFILVDVLANDTDADADATLSLGNASGAVKGSIVLNPQISGFFLPADPATSEDIYAGEPTDGDVFQIVVTGTVNGIATTATVSHTISGGEGGNGGSAIHQAVVDAINADAIASQIVQARYAGGIELFSANSNGTFTTTVTLLDSETGDEVAGTVASEILSNQILYAPNATSVEGLGSGQSTTDTITYTVSDGTVSDQAQLVVTIDGVNDAPVAGNDAVSLKADASSTNFGVLTNDDDPDDNEDATTLVVSNASGFEPASSLGATVGVFDSAAVAQVTTVTVSGAVEANDVYRINVDGTNYSYTAQSGDGTAAVASGLATAVAAATGITDATATGSSVAITGTAGFPFAVGVSSTDTGEIASVLTTKANAGGGVSYDLSSFSGGTDDQGNTITTLDQLALGRKLVDTVTYWVEDAGGLRSQATMTVTITGVNNPPDAVDDPTPYTAFENGTPVQIDVLANDTDPDIGDAAGFLVLAAESELGATITNIESVGAILTYNPSGLAGIEGLAEGEVLTDTVTYTLSDGKGGTDTAQFQVNVTGINDAPDAVDDTASATEDGSAIVINVLGNDDDIDSDDDNSTLTILETDPQTGDPLLFSASGVAVTLTTQAAAPQIDTLSLIGTLEDGDIYRVEIDGHEIEHVVDTASDTSLAALAANIKTEIDAKIAEVNGPPLTESTHSGTPGVPQISVVTFLQGTPYPGDGIAMDISGQTLTATTASGTFDEIYSGIAAEVTAKLPGYLATSTAGEVTITGPDGIPFTVSNLNLIQGPPPVPADPTDTSDPYYDPMLDPTDPAYDMNYIPAPPADALVPGDLTSSVTTPASPGVSAESTVSIVGAIAGDTFEIFVEGQRFEATAPVESLAPNADIAAALASQIDGLTDISAVVSGTDIVITADPSDNDNSFTASPAAAVPSDTLDVSVDNLGDEVVITSTVGGQPFTVFTVAENGVGNANADNDIILTNTTPNSPAAAILYDPSTTDAFDYLAVGETATDTISYTVTDSHGERSTATVTVTVTGTNDDPVAVADTASTVVDGIIEIDAAANDTDVDLADDLTVQTFDATSALGAAITLTNDGTLQYDPTSVDFGDLTDLQTVTDTFQYTVTDSNGGTSTATVTVNVTGTIIGVSGTETLVLQSEVTDRVLGTAGDETITFSGQAQSGDSFDGLGGTDSLTLDDTDDTITIFNTETADAGGGDDTVVLGDTAVTDIDGGSGTDTLDLSLLGSGVNVNLIGGSASTDSGGSPVIDSITFEPASSGNLITTFSIDDINGDGLEDIAAFERSSQNYFFDAYVILSGANVATALDAGTDGDLDLASIDGSNTAGFGFEGAIPGTSFLVLGLEDINGDGIGDMLIEERYGYGVAYYNYVLFGDSAANLAALDTNNDGILELAALDGTDGYRIDIGSPSSSMLGDDIDDVSGDGVADLVIQQFGEGGPPETYLVLGGAASLAALDGDNNGTLDLTTLNGTSAFAIQGPAYGDNVQVSSTGDVNGDGIDDLIVDVRSSVDQSFIIFGGATNLATMDADNDGIIELGTELTPLTGYSFNPAETGADVSLRTIGDVNGDGIDDLQVTENGAASNSEYLLLSGSGAFASLDTGSDGSIDLGTIDGSNNNAFRFIGGDIDSTITLHETGDINGDGINDLLAIDSGVSHATPQVETIIFGGATNLAALDGDNDGAVALAAAGAGTGFQIGFELIANHDSGLADVNGDGFDDFVAQVDTSGESGRNIEIFVLFGGPSGLQAMVADGSLTISDLTTDNSLLLSANTDINVIERAYIGGDIDGDGLADVHLTRLDGDFISDNAEIFFGDTSWGPAASSTVSGIENVHGTAYADTLIGDAGDNELLGGDGSDTLDGGAGNDFIGGGNGDDRVIVSRGDDIVNTNSWGDDTLVIPDNFAPVDAERSGDGDTVVITFRDNTDDTLHTVTLINQNANPLAYVELNDEGTPRTLEVSALVDGTGLTADSVFVGTDAFEAVTGGDGNDVLFGGSGNDVLIGGAGNDIAIGGPGNDTYRFDGGDDTVFGGDGTDTIDVNASFFLRNAVVDDDGLTIGLDDGSVLGEVFIEDHDIQPVERIDVDVDRDGLVEFYDIATGQDASLATADTLVAGTDGDDVIVGGSGNDLLFGGLGSDSFDGGDGVDTVSFTGAAQGVVLDLGNGGSPLTISNVENVFGSDFGDAVTGDAGDNRILGFDGNDLLSGGGGDDELVGGSGNDTIAGESGADTLSGDGQSAVAGEDVFVYAAKTDSVFGAMDTIADFVSGSDRIEFTGMAGMQVALAPYGFDTDVATTIGNITADTGVADKVVFFSDGGDGYVYVNGSGDITPDDPGDFDGTLIKLAGVVTPPASGDYAGVTPTAIFDTDAGGNDGQWFTDANWSTGLTPGSGELAVLTGSGTVTYSGGSSTVGAVVANTDLIVASNLNVEGSFELAAGEILDLSGSVSVLSIGGAETLLGNVDLADNSRLGGTGTVTNSSTIVLDWGNIDADLVNDGTIDVVWTSGEINGAFANNGALNVTGNATRGSAEVVVASGFTNTGTITLDNTDGGASHNATLTVNGTLVNAAAGVIRLDDTAGGSRILEADIDNQGLIDIDISTDFDRVGDVIDNAGTLDIEAGATLRIFGATVNNLAGGDIVNAGQVTVDGTAASLNFADDYTWDETGGLLLLNDGSLGGTGTVTNSSTIVLDWGNIDADLVNDGTIDVVWTSGEINGAFANNGALNVTGNATRGSAEVVVASGFTNTGTITLDNTDGGASHNATLTVNGTLVNAAAGVIRLDDTAGGSRILEADIDNQGLIDIDISTDFDRVGDVIDNAGTLDIEAGATLRIFGATVNNLAGGDIVNAGQVTVDGTAASLNFADDYTWDETGGLLLLNDGSLGGTGTVTNSSTIVLDWGNIDADLVNDGTIDVVWTSGEINGAFANNGALNVTGNATRGSAEVVVASGFTNTGTITLDNTDGGASHNATLTVNGTIINNGTIASVHSQSYGGGRVIDANITNNGTIDLAFDTTISGAILNAGDIVIPEGVTLTIDGPYALNNTGTISGDGTLVLANGAVLGNNGGTVAVGGVDTVGDFTLTGDLDAGAAGNAVAFDIDGDAAFDVLSVADLGLDSSGLADELILDFEFVPFDGQSFQIVNYSGTLTGGFETVTHNLGSGATVSVDYGTGSNSFITITVDYPATLVTGVDGVDDTLTGTLGADTFVASTTTTHIGDLGNPGFDVINLSVNPGGADTLRFDDGFELIDVEFDGTDLLFVLQDEADPNNVPHVTVVTGHATNPLSFVEIDIDSDSALDAYRVNDTTTGLNVSGEAAGDRWLIAGSGSFDTIMGNTLDDLLFGGAGNDIIFGGNGADVIVGGTGVDQLTGGAGGDVYVFSSTSDSGAGSGSRDIINGFNAAEDVIDLSAIVPGDFAFMGLETDIHYSMPSAFVTAGVMKIDATGDGSIDFEIDLSGYTGTLSAANFKVGGTTSEPPEITAANLTAAVPGPTVEDGQILLQLSADDPDGDTLTFTVDTLPTDGTLYQTADGTTPGDEITAAGTTVTDAGGRLLFVPDNDFNGTVAFDFTATDVIGLTDTATINFSVTPVNDAPELLGASLSADTLQFARGDIATIASNAGVATGVGDFTYELWFNSSATGESQEMLMIGDGGANSTAHLYINAQGQLQFDLSSGTDISSSATVNDGVWHHAAVSYESASGTTTLLLDGVPVESTMLLAPNIPAADSFIGSLSGSNDFFEGEMADIRIWDVARSQDDINLNAQLEILQGDTSGLVARYVGDAGNGTLIDVSGNGHDAATSHVLSNGLDLAGDTQFVQNLGTGALTTAATVEFNIDFNDLAGQQNILELWDTDGGRLVIYKSASDDLEIFTSGTPTSYATGYSFTGGEEHHLAVTWDSSDIRVLVDGQFVHTQSVSGLTFGAAAATTVSVGSDTGNVLNFRTDAVVSDVRVWDVARTDSEISSSRHRPDDVDGASGLIAQYRFDGDDPGAMPSSVINAVDSSTAVVNDLGTGAEVATIVARVDPDGGPTVANVGQGTSFDGTGFVTVANDAALDADSWTIETWFRSDAADNTTGNVRLLTLTDGGSHAAYSLVFVNGDLRVEGTHHDGAGSQSVTATESLRDGVWHHVAGTYDDATNTMSLYIDGEFAGSIVDATELDVGTGDLTIGNFSSAHTQQFTGDMADVRIWDRVRSAEEIAGHRLDYVSPDEEGLVANYRLDGVDGALGASVTVTDSGNNGIDGTTSAGGVLTVFSGGLDVYVAGIETTQDVAISGTLLAADVDGDGLTYALETGASNGTVTVNGAGEYTYTPAADYFGADSFEISISDGTTVTYATVAVAVDAAGAMTPPVASNLSAVEAALIDVTIDLTDIVVFDADGDDVTVTLTLSDNTAGVLSMPTSGSVTPTYNAGAGVWTATGPATDINTVLAAVQFDPDPSFEGLLEISTSVNDGTNPAVTGVKRVYVSDTTTATGAGDVVTLTGGDDNVSTIGGDDFVYGGGGNDQIAGYNGDDALLGEDGDDELSGENGSDILLGGSGNDTLDGGSNDAGIDVAMFNGSSTDYTVTEADANGDYDADNDGFIDAGPNIGLAFTAAFGHWAVIDNNAADGDDGIDYLTGVEQVHFLGDSVTMDLNYDLRGSGGDDTINGGTSDDEITGLGGNDVISGGDGDDTITGYNGDDTLFGDAGDDVLIGENGSDILKGGAGNDTLDGFATVDLGIDVAVYDGPSSDYTVTEADANGDYDANGDNLIDAGPNAGLAFTPVFGHWAVIDNNATGGDEGVDHLIDVETVQFSDTTIDLNYVLQTTGGAGSSFSGGANDDALTGAGGNDVISGGDGDDTITGYNGDDTLFGDAGDDVLIGENGSDILKGGAGNDTLDGFATVDLGIDVAVYDGPSSDYTVTEADANGDYDANGDNLIDAGPNAGLAFTPVFGHWAVIDNNATGGDEGVDHLIDVETVQFSDITIDLNYVLNASGGADVIVDGGANDDMLSGGSGNDDIAGLGGNDTISGYNGDDTLFGDAGDDVLEGENGDDTLVGGAGADILTGGTGVEVNGDTFVFEAAADSDANNTDVITDFTTGIDTILLKGISGVDLTPDITISFNSLSQETVSDAIAAIANPGTNDQVYYFADLSGGDGYLYVDGVGTGIDFDGFLVNVGSAVPVVGDIAGDEYIIGTPGDDVLTGTSDDNVIVPDSNTDGDRIVASIGDDVIDFAGAGDSFYEIDYSQFADPIFATLTNTAGSIDKGTAGSQGTDTLLNIDDIVSGNVGGLGITGTAFDDVVSVDLGSEDYFEFEGGGGADTFTGGGGFDRVTFFSAQSAVVVNLNDSIAEAISGQSVGANSAFDGISDTDTLLGSIDSIRGTNVQTSANNGYADVLIGSDNDERFITQQGNDYVDGGGGGADFDMLRYDRSGVGGMVVDMESGTASGYWVQSGSHDYFTDTFFDIEAIRGSNDGDMLIGYTGDDALDGRKGDDVIIGGAGSDTLTGGDGADFFVFESVSESDGTTATDIVTDFDITSDAIVLSGLVTGAFSVAANVDTANAGYILIDLDGNASDDMRIDFGGSFDVSTLTDANFFATDLTNSQLLDNASDDIVSDSSNAGVTLDAGDGDNTLTGGTGDDLLIGGSGNDTLDGGDGNDVILTGGNDGNGGDTILGSLGDDIIDFAGAGEGFFDLDYGALGSISVNLGADGGSISKYSDAATSVLVGDDTVRNFDVIDGWVNGGLTLRGTVGDDVFNIAIADDEWMQVRGGAGDDIFNFDMSSGGQIRLDYVAEVSGIVANLGVNGDDVYSGFNVAGGGVLDGDGGTDSVIGDFYELRATDDNDVLIGSTGDDRFITRQGDDVVDGNGGYDTVRYDRSGVTGLEVDLHFQTATGQWFGADFTDTLIDIDQIRGSRDDATVFRGSANADGFVGRSGQNDTIEGRGGADALYGGSGADTFVYSSVGDSQWGGTLASSQYDTLQDFVSGSDTIAFNNMSTSIGIAAYGAVQSTIDATVQHIIDNGATNTIHTFVYGFSTYVYVKADGTLPGTNYDGLFFEVWGNVPQSGDIVYPAGVGTYQDDIILGTAGADSIVATEGYDTVIGLGGGDTLIIDVGFALEGAYLSGTDLVVEYENLSDFSFHSTTIYDHQTTPFTGVEFDIDENGIRETYSIATVTGTTAATVGGANDIVIVGDSAANDITGSASGFDVILGNDGNDTITVATAAGSLVDGGAGDDTITGGTGADYFTFGDGHDTFDVSNGGGDTLEIDDTLFFAGAYRDTANSNAAVIDLTDSTPTAHSATVSGHNDDVTVEFDFNADGSPEAFLLSTDGDATGLGGAALVLGDNNGIKDDLLGSAYNDLLIGDVDGGRIDGGLGDDILVVTQMDGGGQATSRVDGGDGTDTVSFGAYAVSGMTIDLAIGEAETLDANAYTRQLLNVENAIGTGLGDEFYSGT